ncbi:MutS-related protein [Mariniphaga sp.]|uniref:MutS-related protein n=1 Tax=Mariniphaga sp. TaxID=1954475 RepID=UPI003568424A
METSASEFYRSKQETFKSKLKTVSQKIRLFAWYRLAAFILIFIPVAVWGWKGWLTVFPAMFFMGFFFFLVKKNIQLERQKKKFKALKKITEDELLALKHQFSHFENGKEFLNPAHFNSYDLDLFGEDSVFQFINRTSTLSGKQRLAEWLQSPPLDKTEIEQRQEAVRELSKIPNWRLHFLANGHLFKETPELNEEIKRWSETDLKLNRPAVIRVSIIVIPLLTILAAIPAFMGISNLWIVLMVFIQWAILWFSRKRIAQYYEFFGRKSELLGKYMQLLEFIEEREFQAPFLLDLQKKVRKPDKASHIFRQLKKLVGQFEYRQNLVIAIVFNSLFLWDLRCVYKLWNWHRRNQKKLTVWLDVIAETDALISLANLAYNHPEFVYPEIHDGGFTFHAKQLGHPLLPAEKRINNDLFINGWGKVLIITGANMAGKSTFLRTVGVNLILGRTGAPVCAKKLVFSPIKVYTNMRTTDNLLKDESYFFAELKRIKTVLDRLEKGEKIFVILDEMLKGTNSVDKLNGSRQLIRKLLELKAVALIATHDLKISEMEKEYPQMVFNKCFEIELENDEMIFDYLLTDGVTKTMNATFLMKKMGII